MAVIDENACLDVLQRRFTAQKIYTNCGPLLVAVNPYCAIDGLYSPEVLEAHLELMHAEPLEPHVYQMAARAYQKMMETGGNQAVVISGESGAGKTETAKYLLHYLARAAAGNAGDEDDERSSLQKRVMGTNPIMESYGCAKTVRNDNSSRFGKLVLLKFTRTGRLSAASMQTYLLEKSRVVQQAPNEANYHCFYEILAGVAPDEQPAMLTGTSKADFEYINTEAGLARDEERDGGLYEKTSEAMDAVGISTEERLGGIRLIAAILHLGNIDFGEDDLAAVDEEDEALVAAARLLGCEPEHLGAGMCSRKLKAGADWVTTQNTVAQASETRHALAKQLYSFYFTSLVKKINASLEYQEQGQSYGVGPHIAYVDIFGFEVFKQNSLEQLCINFANEKLQRLFVGVLFESVQKMYEAEGIETDKVEFSDNKRVVDLIGGAPQGLLAMLTEECVFPKGSDSGYLSKITNAFSKRFVEFNEVKTSPTDFVITHYAGEVTYTCTGFLEKNKDPISQDLQVLVEFSEDPFIAATVKLALQVGREQAAAAAADEKPGKSTKMKSGKFVGVVDGFKASLKSLIGTLQEGELHFIRCLKPNDAKEEMGWDRAVSARQLLSAGIVSAVSATRSGFSDHMPPQHIIGAFGPLAPDVPTEGMADSATAEAVLEACGVTAEQYAVGNSKIFLRQGVLNELQRLRLEHISQHATMVQCAIRRVLARQMYRKLKEAAERKAEEKRRREEELRRQREEAERRRLQALREEEERRKKAEEAELERRKQVQKARSMSFDRKRRKKVEEEERKAREEAAAKEVAARKRAEQAEEKRREADERMQASLAAAGVSVTAASMAAASSALENRERDIGASYDDVEAAVARAEAEAAGAAAATSVQLPESPDAPAGASGFSLKLGAVKGAPPLSTGSSSGSVGGGAPSGFKLQLPPSPGPQAPKPMAAPKALVEQKKLDEMAANFVCPLEDVMAYAEMVGMDTTEDVDLLWLADEALQAPEPVGWEQRQDPRGNTYYFNTTTNMTMMQHPVDYHYQQLYLQYKMQRTMQQNMAQMTPRSRAAAGEAIKKDAAPDRDGNFKLDLRSLSADGDDAPLATPKGWLRRSVSQMTPRSSKAAEKDAKRELAETLDSFVTQEIDVSVKRGKERLGMELNAYNQILSFVPGGPTDRHPNMNVYDRILAVDGIELGTKMLTDVLVPHEVQKFRLERWLESKPSSTKIPQPVFLALGKARHGGASVEQAARQAFEEHATILSKKGRRKASMQANDNSATLSRFTVTIARGEHGGLGLVLDEENVVTDMVPGSPVDLARSEEVKGDPRLQIGDKIMTVDGEEVDSERPLSQVIEPADEHTMSVERIVEAKDKAKASPPPSPMSPRGVFKMLSPRASKADKGSPSSAAKGAPASKPPSRALREVRIYKASDEERLGIRFVRDDEGFDRNLWGRDDMVCPIVAALDPKGEAARSGIEIDDMVLSINGQTGLSNTEAAAMLRDLAGTITIIVRKCEWLGVGAGQAEEEISTPEPATPRTAMRRLV